MWEAAVYYLQLRVLPVSSHIQHMQLGGICKLSGQFAQAVVSQWENVEAGTAAQLFGHAAQTVAVYIQVGQLLQLAQRARKWLWESETRYCR